MVTKFSIQTFTEMIIKSQSLHLWFPTSLESVDALVFYWSVCTQ